MVISSKPDNVNTQELAHTFQRKVTINKIPKRKQTNKHK